MNIDNIVLQMMTFQQQLRILHWGTKIYARHMAYGSTYEALDDLIDEFVEVHQGKYGRATFNGASIKLEKANDVKVNDFLKAFEMVLVKGVTGAVDAERDTELLNIRDEILALVNKLKYLLSLE